MRRSGSRSAPTRSTSSTSTAGCGSSTRRSPRRPPSPTGDRVATRDSMGGDDRDRRTDRDVSAATRPAHRGRRRRDGFGLRRRSHVRVTGGEPPTLDGLRRRYEALAAGRSPDGTESWLNWIVRTHDGSPAVGVVQATIVDASSHASIAWEIGVPWQGHGFAAEAATGSSSGSRAGTSSRSMRPSTRSTRRRRPLPATPAAAHRPRRRRRTGLGPRARVSHEATEAASRPGAIHSLTAATGRVRMRIV